MKNKTAITVLAIWTFIHIVLFVLGMNTYRIRSYKPAGEVFYPFEDRSRIFHYDYLEAVVYIGVPILIYLLYQYNKKGSE